MTHGRIFAAFLICVLSVTTAVRGQEAADSPAKTELVRAILADHSGDTAARETHLRDALAADGEFEPARWYDGQLKAGKEWVSVEEFEEANANKRAIGEYEALRAQLAGSLIGQISLAQWCQQHGLPAREKLHWAMVLKMSPTNKLARRRLDIREHRGVLMTNEQFQTIKQWEKDHETAKRRWTPQLAELRKAIMGKDADKRDAAILELSEVRDSEAIPFIEEQLSGRSDEIDLLVVGLLDKIPTQEATNSLVRHAVFASRSTARTKAAKCLAERSWYAFIPGLLANLQTPLELTYYVNTLSDGAAFGFRIEQETPSTINSFAFNHRTRSQVIRTYRFSLNNRSKDDPLRGKVLYDDPKGAPDFAAARLGAFRVNQVGRSVLHANIRSKALNRRIFDVLQEATQQQHGTPQAWWTWWQEYNELQQSGKRLVQRSYSGYARRTSTQLVYSEPSCFMPGTAVWTDTGRRPIESVKVGDRVLAQDQESGELDYQLVLGTTIRPPSPTLRLRLDGEDIVTTPGHPFWVAGQGWRMAKHLKVGDRLHGLRGSVKIETIEEGPESVAHNLIVDRFNSYFVGGHRLLVHDNRARIPTKNNAPGFVASK